MIERQLPSGIFVSTADTEPITTPQAGFDDADQTLQHACYPVRQTVRALSDVRRQQEYSPYVDPEISEEHLAVLDTVASELRVTCGRICTKSCGLQIIKRASNSPLQVVLDISERDQATLDYALQYLKDLAKSQEPATDEFEKYEQSKQKRMEEFVKGVATTHLDAHHQRFSQELVEAGYSRPEITQACYGFLGQLTNNNFHVVLEIMFRAHDASLTQQQAGPDQTKSQFGFCFANPLSITPDDLIQLLIFGDRSWQYSLNLKSTEKTNTFR